MGIDPTDVYLVEFHFLTGNTIRFKLTERDPIYPRYDQTHEYSIVSIDHVSFKVKAETKSEVTIIFGANDQNSLVMFANPFKFELAADGTPAISWNERGCFH
jgi:alpha 1,3-glucosidase